MVIIVKMTLYTFHCGYYSYNDFAVVNVFTMTLYILFVVIIATIALYILLW